MNDYKDEFNFEPLLNSKLVHIDVLYLPEGIMQDTHSYNVYLKWDNGVYLMFRMDGTIDEKDLMAMLNQRLVKLDGPSPNYSSTTVGWWFENGNVLYINIIGGVTWN